MSAEQKGRQYTYIVLDEGRPIKKGPRGFVSWETSAYPVALFDTNLEARRVRDLVRSRHADVANQCDPNASEDNRKRFELWLTRMKGVRIHRTLRVTATLAETRRCK